jgi:hypothetical protein
MKMLFDGPTICCGPQDQLDTHLSVCAYVRRPIAPRVLEQYDTYAPANDVARCQKRFVTARHYCTSTAIGYRFPSTLICRSLLQRDSVLSVLTWPTPLSVLVYWEIEQLCITTKPRYYDHPSRNQRSDQRFGCVGSVEHHNEAGLTLKCSKRPYHLHAKIQGKFVFRAKFPVITQFQFANVTFANIEQRQQWYGDDAEQRMPDQHRQADPVMTIQPVSI